MKKFNLLLIFVLIFIVLSSSAYSINPINGVLYLNFTNLGNRWASGNATNVNASSSATYPSFFISGNSGPNSFDFTKSVVTYPNSADLNSDTFSISFWMNPDSKVSGNRVISKEGTTNGYARYNFVWDAGGNLEFVLYNTGPTAFTAEVPSAGVPTGSWSHIVGTYNSTTKLMKVYSNGVYRQNATLTGTRMAGDTQPLQIGRFDTNFGLYYDGKIDEIQYYKDRVLSIGEVNDLYKYGRLNETIAPLLNLSVSAKNFYDNSTINNFNVSIKYKYYSNSTTAYINKGTTSGTLNTNIARNDTGCYRYLGGYSRINCLVNITYYKNGIYFNSTYSNLNITTSPTGYLKQNWINISIRELFTNNTISNVVIKLNGTTKVNTTNSWGLVYPKNSTYIITVFDKLGSELYHATSNSLTTTYKNNFTKYVYVHQHYLTIKGRNAITNASINTFNVTITSLNISDIRTLGTSTGTLNIPVIHNTYNTTIYSLNYADYNNTKQFVITSNQTYTFRLYANNSITFNIYNLTSLKLTNKTINIQMIGEHSTYNYITTNGTKFTGSIIPDVTYRCVFTSTSFNTQTQYITLLGGEHRNVNVYMDTGLVSKSFNVKDATNNLNLEGVVLTFYELINGSQVSVGQLTTDYFGSGSIYLSSSKSYSFTATRTNYTDFTGTITPSESTYSFSMNRIVGTEFDSVFNSIYMPQPTFNYYPLQGKAFNSYTLTSSQGVVTYFGYNYTYDGVNYIENLSTSPLGGILTDNFTVDLLAQNNVTITYFYKITGNDLYSFDRNYFMGYTPENFTLAGGIFDDLEDLSGTSGYWKGIIAYIIIVALIVILLKLTGNMNIAILGGLGGFAIAWSYNLLPHNLILLSGGIIVFFWIIEKAWMD